jgi:glutamyl-tRNA reductase
MRPLIVGANHRTAPLSLRDTLFVDDLAQADFLKELGLPQAVVISTCDRVEIWTVCDDPDAATPHLWDRLARRGGLPVEALAGQLYTLTDAAAIRHCFAVTASLDSLVIGEPQVLGQVKACHRLSRDAGRAGPEIDGLMAAAYAAAKRVRSETPVAERPVSIASAAVQLARDLHGALSSSTALLIGSGDMGELVAEHLLGAGISRLIVSTQRISRAEAIAERLKCHAAPYEKLSESLVDADIVVTAVGSRQTVLSSEQVTSALRARRRKPIFLVDVAMPGDIEPAVNRIDGAFLYDLNDLERLAMEGRAGREQAAAAGFAIIDAMAEDYRREKAGRLAVPALILLREHFEKLRLQAISESGGDAEKATRLLVNRLLHDPSEMMKLMAGGDARWPAAEELLRRLFRLEEKTE